MPSARRGERSERDAAKRARVGGGGTRASGGGSSEDVGDGDGEERGTGDGEGGEEEGGEEEEEDWTIVDHGAPASAPR